MNKEKLGQEPAFPLKSEGIANRQEGMSKRFYAACAIMQGILANMSILEHKKGNASFSRTVNVAYQAADELLKQENE
jgi:hypothetical protein